MAVSWTLHVEGFGKIQKADIEVKPLMLFVGDNNSGKSYLASLLWGMQTVVLEEFIKFIDKSHDEFIFFEQVLEQASDEIIFNQDLADHLVKYFNIFLSKKNESIFSKIFNTEGYFKKISVSIKVSEECKIKIEKTDNQLNMFYIYPIKKIAYNQKLYSQKPKKELANKILLLLIKDVVFESGLGPVFLPASRTGFILTYKALVSDLMNSWGEKSAKIKFSAPIIDFLQKITEIEINNEDHQYSNIAEAIENDILKGQIKLEQGIANEFSYQPQNLAQKLPFYLSSSLITELAPIVIFLKYNSDYSAMIIEEPEAHLHLAVQRILTRNLVKLVNRKVPILITTHSDTIFQQVNNLISLYQHPDRAKLQAELGYSDEELIAPEDVAAYQFTNTPDGTIVESLELTENGFAVPTFNETIFDLSKETLTLQ